MQIDAVFHPRVSLLKAAPQDLADLLHWAAVGARYAGMEYPNGEPARAYHEQIVDRLKELAGRIEYDALLHEQDKGL
jgi:hypothetical protein